MINSVLFVLFHIQEVQNFLRSVDEIKNEIQQYIKNGIQRSYFTWDKMLMHIMEKIKIKKMLDLAYLIRFNSRILKIKRIRYMTSHPNDMSESLINATCYKCTKLMPFLHLPIQSGSDRILKKMNRKHTRKQYFEIIEKLKINDQILLLSSDFIVGFPGETDEDFDLTMELSRKCKIFYCLFFYV